MHFIRHSISHLYISINSTGHNLNVILSVMNVLCAICNVIWLYDTLKSFIQVNGILGIYFDILKIFLVGLF